MKYINVSLIICLLSLLSCNSDDYHELSGNYFYRGEGGPTEQILSNYPDGNDIYGKVLDHDYNSDFIVAVQKPDYDDYKAMVAFSLGEDTANEYTPISISVAADSILRNDPRYARVFKNKLNYWIISNKEHKLYGPLTAAEYARTRELLKVPNTVRLNSEER